MTARAVLLVEDDVSVATVITAALNAEGYVVTCSDSIAGRDRLLARGEFAIMLTDVMLTDGDGIETLPAVRERYPHLPVIILSAQNTLDTAVRASDTGAFEYFPKPFDLDELVGAVHHGIGQGLDRARAPEPTAEPIPPGLPLVGRSAPMQAVYRMITRVLRNDLTVLILGESGTGKELVAEAIHQLGNRGSGPFVAVNAAAIPHDLIESELFGHEKGAFTGATARHLGKFELAAGGTLFLDEIGDMPIEAQTRLLRALQSGRIRRVGGAEDIVLDCRIVAATNRDLMPMIAAGTFRQDLYYRLAVVPIELPPLRDRADDIAALSHHFLTCAANEGLPRRQLTAAASALLARQPWRGNVRELRNLIYRLALMARDDVIDVAAIEPMLAGEAPSRTPEPRAPGDLAAVLGQWLIENPGVPGQLYDDALAVFERPLFLHVLAQTAGNQLRAAQILGINHNTLRKRLQELGIHPEDAAIRALSGGLPFRPGAGEPQSA